MEKLQTHEEATVYVKELEKFLTTKVLENTPAVLSFGKICDENGYSYEWINGQKPHLIKDGIRIICNTENFVPIVVPGLSSSSSSSSHPSTSMTPSRQESHHPTSSSSSSSSPTTTGRTGHFDPLLGCTQREAKVHHHAAQLRADLFRRITTTDVTEENSNTKHFVGRTQRGLTTWKDTLKSASKGAASLLEEAYQQSALRASWRRTATLCGI